MPRPAEQRAEQLRVVARDVRALRVDVPDDAAARRASSARSPHRNEKTGASVPSSGGSSPRSRSTGITPSPNQYASSRCGIAGEDELVEAELVVLRDAIGDLFVRADERGADAAAHEADARPTRSGTRRGRRRRRRAATPCAAARPTAWSRSRPARPRSRRRSCARAARRRPPTLRRRSAGRSRGSGCRSRASRPAAAARPRMRVDALATPSPAARPTRGTRRRARPRSVRPRRTRRRSRCAGSVRAAAAWSRPRRCSARPRSRTARRSTRPA